MMAPQPDQLETQDAPVGEPSDITLPDDGDRIADKYIITKRLGEGGMGVVYEAVHLRLRQPVALKFLHPDALTCRESCARFEREARAAGQLKGPHAAHVLDVDVRSDGLPYIVMELLKGRDLEAEMQTRTAPFPVAEAVDYLLETCAAMAEAHALGIVHRDLKPSNLFLHEEDDGSRLVKVLDFGISKILLDKNQPNVTSTCVSIGTPLYMSPEQVRSAKHVDGRADIWSMAIILYELLVGQPPFVGTATAAIAAIVADDTPGLRSARPDVPPELERVILRALEKDPDDRYADVHEFAAALAPFGTRELTMPREVTRPSFSTLPDSSPLVTYGAAKPANVNGNGGAATTGTAAGDPERVRATATSARRRALVETAALARRLFTGPLARFQLPRARATLGIGLALLMVPVLTWGLTDRSTPANVFPDAVESPHLAGEDSPALPGVAVHGHFAGAGLATDPVAARAAAPRREAHGSVAASERGAERDKLLAAPPAPTVAAPKAVTLHDAHDNPLYL